MTSGKQHPPYLTTTERYRMIRALYQIRGLALVDSATRQQRVDAMRLKDLALLCDVTMFYTDYIEEAPTIKDLMKNEPGILGQGCQAVHLRFQRLAAKLHNEKIAGYLRSRTDEWATSAFGTHTRISSGT